MGFEPSFVRRAQEQDEISWFLLQYHDYTYFISRFLDNFLFEVLFLLQVEVPSQLVLTSYNLKLSTSRPP